MKIRSTDELVGFLGQSKQERKRELLSLSLDLLPKKEDPSTRLRRAAVVLAYAHWEGFVRDAARAYVCLVSHKSRSLSALSLSFQALACRQELAVAQCSSCRIQPHLAVVKRLVDDIGRSCRINPDTAIDTESNLTSAVFRNICLSVGLNYDAAWGTRGPFIDDLFRSRCEIAHGELFTPDTQYARETVQFSIWAIDIFATDIENAAVQNAFLRC